MIPQEEVETLVKRIFGEEFISAYQVNKSTIRIELTDAFVDVFQSLREAIKFAFHAEFNNGRIYRLDNRPERSYKKFKTYPWHFHEGKEEKISASPFSAKKRIALEQFLNFLKKEMNAIPIDRN